jgi:hypothetical protein
VGNLFNWNGGLAIEMFALNQRVHLFKQLTVVMADLVSRIFFFAAGGYLYEIITPWQLKESKQFSFNRIWKVQNYQ